MSTGIDLPDPLRLPSTLPFVGRSAELELLRALMPSAAGEQRRVVLLAGEPGAGKSRLVRELAGTLARRGTLVLHGACDAVVPAPCGPFAEALGRIVQRAERSADPLAELGVDSGAGELSRLLPELAARAPGLAPSATADADSERHRLHVAVTALLATAARRQPVLLVLEDGHWADHETLLLLRHLARTSWGGRVLLLSTFRDTAADASRELSETLADLRRCDDVVRMRLGPLSEAEVADFVRSAAGCGAGHAPGAPGAPGADAGARVEELARAIRDLTGGNAFLVCELWRALVESGTVVVDHGRIAVVRPLHELSTPASVREVVGQRLARLDPVAAGLLELAATFGPVFELGPVQRAAGLREQELIAAVEEAVASGIVEELPGPRLVCRFTHELVRHAICDRLSQARRAELRLRVGEAAAGLRGSGLPNGLSPREAQILALAARGLSNREIGDALAISEHTAANHIRSILRKTDCANRTEAASFAHRHGLASTTRRPLPRRSTTLRSTARGRRGGRR